MKMFWKDFIFLNSQNLLFTVSDMQTPETSRDNTRTVYVMQMGQFINHDIDHVPNHQSKDSKSMN